MGSLNLNLTFNINSIFFNYTKQKFWFANKLSFLRASPIKFTTWTDRKKNSSVTLTDRSVPQQRRCQNPSRQKSAHRISQPEPKSGDKQKQAKIPDSRILRWPCKIIRGILFYNRFRAAVGGQSVTRV